MKAFVLLLISTLILAASAARAAEERSEDLRYCLKLQTNHAIAKCAGEISAGNKGKTLSKEEVDKMLSREQASDPAITQESQGTHAPDTPATESDQPGDISLPEKTEGSGN